MRSEDVAALVKEQGIKTILDALEILDPDVKLAITTLEQVKAQGYGRVSVTVANGQIMMIEPTIQLNLRKRT